MRGYNNNILCNIIIKQKGENTMRETFMADNASAKAMNKIMFFMANCGYDEVKETLL